LIYESLYALDLMLPYPVYDKKGRAKYDKKGKCLEVTLPVQAKVVVHPGTVPAQSPTEDTGNDTAEVTDASLSSSATPPSPRLVSESTEVAENPSTSSLHSDEAPRRPSSGHITDLKTAHNRWVESCDTPGSSSSPSKEAARGQSDDVVDDSLSLSEKIKRGAAAALASVQKRSGVANSASDLNSKELSNDNKSNIGTSLPGGDAEVNINISDH